MSANKDFRNVKQTQFDRGQVLKGSFSELHSALRTLDTNAILKDAYTHFIQTLDSEKRPINVEYFQATEPARDQITFVSDNNGSLVGQYIVLEDYITKKTTAIYYVVSGTGSAPQVADQEIPVNIETNDNAATVCFATKDVIESLDKYIVTRKSALSNFLVLEYFSFGETSEIDNANSSFFVTRIQDGNSCLVGTVELEYDPDGDVIYNGNILKGLAYNAYNGKFEASNDVDLEPVVSKIPQIFNVNMPNANTEYSQALPIGTKRFAMKVQGNKSKYTISFTSGGNVYSVSRGTEYSEQDLKLTSSTNTIYFSGTKNNLIMEIIAWT